MRPAALRTLLRLAVRDARRDRWRTLLVVVMVALPVAGLVGAVSLADAMAPTAEERATERLGRADVMLEPTSEPTSAPEVAARAAEVLPPGGRIEIVGTAGATLVVDGIRRPGVTITDAPLDPEALSAGRYDLLDGRAPATRSEVAASAAVLDRAGVSLGETIEVEELGTVTVVGEVRVREWLGAQLLVAVPAALADVWHTAFVTLPPGAPLPQPSPRLVVDQQGDWDTAEWVLTSRTSVLAQRFSTGERAVAVVIGGLAAVEVALIAGAAFAVSVRRRQRELGLLAAAGGTRGHVRRVVLLTGVVTGVLGAVAGAVLGAAAAVATSPWLDGWADRVTGGVVLDPAWLLVSGGIGMSAAVLGAWWPARGVARLPVVVALSGRRPAGTPAGVGLRAGLVLAAAGGAVCLAGTGLGGVDPYVFLLGAVLVVLGAGLCSPWLLERAGRLAPSLPTGPRLALRDAARFRTRNGPIVTAAMAGLAASVTIATVLGSMSAQERASYTPRLPPNILTVSGFGADVAAATIGRDLGATPHRLSWASGGQLTFDGGATPADGALFPYGYRDARADEALARDLYGEEAAQAIASGRAVLVSTSAAVTTVSFEPIVDLATWETSDRVDLPVTIVPPAAGMEAARGPSGLPNVLIPELHAGLADPEQYPEFVLALDRPVDDAMLQTVATTTVTFPDVEVDAETGYVDHNAQARQIVLLVCALFGLGIVTVALALAAAEGRADQRTLVAVGAPPRLRRSLAASRALVLAGLGGLLAVPVGLVPAYTLIASSGRDLPYIVPWAAIGLVAIAVPATAVVGAVLLTRGVPGGASLRHA